MIGGGESMRDIHEASNLNSEAFEFTLIESIFALNKIFSAINQVFIDRLETLKDAKIFINISTLDGLEMLTDLENIVLPHFLTKSNIVFNFDRRSITRTFKKIKSSNFEYIDFEDEINPIIYEKIIYLNNINYLTSISGGVSIDSVKKILDEDVLVNYIKTGLFTLPYTLNKKRDLIKEIKSYQIIEAKILRLMKDSLFNRFDYIDKRQMHMVNYLL
tara:strand:+ start:659 stop:1309 length:651 start_codon:yes stop_codon:yes gene_type:complete